jgi:hypothetical protein
VSSGAREQRQPSAPEPLQLVVLGDSTAFTDACGPQLPGHPTLYPTVVAGQIGGYLAREVQTQVVARPGQTVRDAARAVTKDQHLMFQVLAGADAVVVGLGSFDHAPLGVPPSLEAVIPHVHPSARRRRVRGLLRTAYPRLVRLQGGRRPRTGPTEFARLYTLLLEQIRGLTQGRAAGVALGPTSHASAYYGHRHPGVRRAEARQLALATRLGFAPVPCWPHVRTALTRLNPDAIHWPTDVHQRVGTAVAQALLPQLTGAAPTIGMPGTWVTTR